jgi:hypothetical protein
LEWFNRGRLLRSHVHLDYSSDGQRSEYLIEGGSPTSFLSKFVAVSSGALKASRLLELPVIVRRSARSVEYLAIFTTQISVFRKDGGK